MLGTMGMESCDSRSWNHSRIGFQLMEEKSYIGDLYSPNFDSEWIIRKVSTNTAVFSDDEWSLNKKIQLSSMTYNFEFKNSKFKIQLNTPGVRWMGRHYILSNSFKSRLYTNCTMLSTSVSEYRKKLIKYYLKEIENTGKGVEAEDLIYPEETDNLNLVIKVYEGPLALSRELREAYIGKKYTLQGPIVNLI